MLALVQRVSEAGVTIDGIRRASIGQGLLVLVCRQPGDTEERIEQLAKKVLKLRIFRTPDGKMNLSVQDIQGGGARGLAVYACRRYELGQPS